MKDARKTFEMRESVDPARTRHSRVVDWQSKTIAELRQTTPIEEQMIVSILATAWRSNDETWDKVAFETLLKNFARDINTSIEHRIHTAMRSMASGADVVESLASAELISPLTHEAIRIATVKNQLDEFFGCWLSQPLVGGDLVPFEQTLMSKFFRLGLTGLVVLNIFVFVLLFIIPEFQKMYEEFGLEMTPASQFLMLWSDRFVKLWFIPFFLVLVLGFFFFRGPSFANWWRRWSSRLWTAQNWNRKDRDRLVTAWELRPMKDTETQKCAGASISAESNSTATIARWHETSFAGVLSKSESFALAATNDQELKDWLLEKMIKSKRERRALRRNVWGTILFGVGHCAIGLLVFLVALSVFGSLLEIVHGLAGGRP